MSQGQACWRFTVTWTQGYDPLGHWWLSTLVAALPVVVLLGALAVLRIKAHWAALLGLAASLVIAVGVFKMPAGMGARTAGYGACYGLFPIGWVLPHLNFFFGIEPGPSPLQIPPKSLLGL